jgi:ribosomal protein S18 acetylase RimI-like enzyme
MVIAVRELTPAFIPQVLPLWHAAGLQVKPSGRDHPKRIEQEIAAYPHNFIGAFDGERLVGVVVATWDGRKGWINRLAVHPEYRRQKLGQALITAAEQELERRGALIIAALIEPDNDASLKLFESSGFDKYPDIVYVSKRKEPNV